MADCKNCSLFDYHVLERGWEQYHETPIRLNNIARNEKVPGAALVILLPAPMMDMKDRLLELKKLLKKYYPAFSQTPVLLVTAIGCNYPSDMSLPKKSLSACSGNLEAILGKTHTYYPSAVLLTSGVESIAALKGIGFSFSDKRKTGLHYNRRVCHSKNAHGFKVFCTVSFHKKTLGSSEEAIWANDIAFMLSWLEGRTQVLPIEYHTVWTSEEVNILAGKLSQAIITNGMVLSACDTETNKLNIFGVVETAKLLTVQICFEPGIGYTIPFEHPEAISRLQLGGIDKKDFLARAKFIRWFLENPKILKITHNGMFDYRVFFAKRFLVRGWVYDTILIHHLVHSDDRRSLDLLAKLYTYLGDYDSELEHYKSEHPEADPSRGGTYANIPLSMLSRYGAIDAIATFTIFWELMQELEEAGLVEFYQSHVVLAQLAFIRMSCKGMRVDKKLLWQYYQEYYDKTQEYYQERIASLPLVKAFEDSFPENKVYREYLADPKGYMAKNKKRTPPKPERFNPNSNNQLAELLENWYKIPVFQRTPAKKIASYSKEVREYLMKYPVTNNMWGVDLEIVHAVHIYILQMHEYSNFIKKLVEDDILDSVGRVHCSFKLFGAKTGRSSCVAGSTALDTDQGTFAIRDLCLTPGAEYSIITHRGRYRRILAKIYKGVQPMFRVTLEGGSQIVCTSEHRFLTPDGWECLGDLVVGSVVIGS